MLGEKDYRSNLVIISSKRAGWHNSLLTLFGAAKQSQHLSGKALDVIVLDVNNDGDANDKDVQIGL